MHTDSLTVPATLDSLPAIASFVLAVADRAGLEDPIRYRLRLAVDELATNIVTYAYAGVRDTDPASTNIHVVVEMDDETLTVILEDTGIPFDPGQVSVPDDLHLPADQRKIGGLGIFLALGGVDRFSYERVGNCNRSILVVNRPKGC